MLPSLASSGELFGQRDTVGDTQDYARRARPHCKRITLNPVKSVLSAPAVRWTGYQIITRDVSRKFKTNQDATRGVIAEHPPALLHPLYGNIVLTKIIRCRLPISCFTHER